MYKFRLETILNHRKNEEEKVQKELSDLNLVLLDEQKKKELTPFNLWQNVKAAPDRTFGVSRIGTRRALYETTTDKHEDNS